MFMKYSDKNFHKSLNKLIIHIFLKQKRVDPWGIRGKAPDELNHVGHMPPP